MKIIKELLARRLAEKAEPEDTLIKTSYRTTQKELFALGKKFLGKSSNAHMFRHTAATRMADKLNRQQLCIWFGWRFSSPMPDRYIKRKGVDMNSVVESFERNNFEELESKYESLVKELEVIRPIIKKLERSKIN